MDGARAAEPYVIQRDNGDWIVAYMGDADPAGGFTEQVGIAISTTGIEGPYSKSPLNPVIAFGPPGSIDYQTIADPWVIKYGNTYYIGYTASPTKAGWNTTYATTTDWITYTKSNTIILNQGPGAYDQASAFRGAVTRVNDTYIFPYTGQGSGGFQFCLSTQPVYMTTPSIINNAEAVFDFYDGFDGTQLQTTKWSILKQFAQTGTATVNNGILTVRSLNAPSYDIITLTGNTNFGPGYLIESLARHSDANGSGTTAAELGFGNAARTDMLRIFDYSSPLKFTKNATANSVGGQDFGNLMAHDLDNQNFLLHRIYWKSSLEANFALDGDVFEPITTNIPSVSLPPWIMCASLPNQATLMVDWIRVRKMALIEPTLSISLEQNQTPPATPVAIVSLQPTCSVPTGTITVTSSIVGLHFSIDGLNYSNTSGIFTSVPPGNYNVTAMNSDGCISLPSSILTITQPATIPFNGIIQYYNSTFTNLNNVKVELYQGTLKIYPKTGDPDVITNGSGVFSFANVCPGIYDIVISTDEPVRRYQCNGCCTNKLLGYLSLSD